MIATCRGSLSKSICDLRLAIELVSDMLFYSIFNEFLNYIKQVDKYIHLDRLKLLYAMHRKFSPGRIQPGPRGNMSSTSRRKPIFAGKVGAGKLTMASTHIGCLEDIPVRTLDNLRLADLVVFEDHRPARTMLRQAGIHREYLNYNEHHQSETLSAVREALNRGQHVVYCSDQGCPSLADPGRALVLTATEAGSDLEVVPGPSALTAAISISPIPTNRFHFAGFPPKSSQNRLRWLEQWQASEEPVIMMDTPYRLHHLLADCSQTFGPKREAFLAIDLSMPNQTTFFDSLEKVQRLSRTIKKRNFVLICAGRKKHRRS